MPFKRKKKKPKLTPDTCDHPRRKLVRVATVTKGGVTYEIWRCRACGGSIKQ